MPGRRGGEFNVNNCTLFRLRMLLLLLQQAALPLNNLITI